GIIAQGETALYDAIGTAIRELNDEKNRRAIVVLSDGGDNASIDSYDDLKKKAESAGIPIYFIAYDTGSDTQQRDVDSMKNLAAETGGFVAVAREQDLAAKYHEIEKDLRAQFAIRYQITDYAKPNQWRAVRVLVASPKLTARTIRGYFAQ
ncbi:MAG TPA: VWA domain-containing protein, partial [Thermoanaerobaculia bacterium]|nr:VWA domain-containing protein [Thermoanaerobaculia bacterium]